MPEIANVASGESILSSWGNLIRDRTIQRYATSTERDNEHPSPLEGDLAWVDNDNQIKVHDGAAWLELMILSATGTLRDHLDAGAKNIDNAARIRVAAGTVGAPTHGFQVDGDTGIYRQASNVLGFAAGGVLGALINSGGIEVVNGSAANPSMSFHQDSNNGWYRIAADQMGLALAGVKRFHFVHAGNGSRIYGSETNDWLEIDGVNEWFQFFLNDSEVVRFATDGVIVQGGSSFLGYSAQPSLAGGVGDFTAYWDDDHSHGWRVGTTASSRALKKNIKDFAGDPRALFGLRLREFDIKAGHAHRSNQHRTGLVAEEVEEVMPELVAEHDGLKRIRDGQPLMTYYLAALQNLDQRLTALEA